MNPTPDPIEPTVPEACRAFHEHYQRVLDRELPSELLLTSHTEQCANCREIAALTRTLLPRASEPIIAPEGLTQRILDAAVADRWARRRSRWATGAGLAALAAALLVAGYLALDVPKPDQSPEMAKSVPVKPSPAEIPPPRFDDRVADAGSALASISQKAKDQTVTPTMNFLPPPSNIDPPTSNFPAGADPAAESIADIPQNAKSGIEPVTSTTLRAVSLFLRDTGMSSQAKPKS